MSRQKTSLALVTPKGVNPPASKTVPDPIADLPRLVSVETLSRHWDRRADTLRAMARRGELPSKKIGRCVMFDVDELARWLDRQ